MTKKSVFCLRFFCKCGKGWKQLALRRWPTMSYDHYLGILIMLIKVGHDHRKGKFSREKYFFVHVFWNYTATSFFLYMHFWFPQFCSFDVEEKSHPQIWLLLLNASAKTTEYTELQPLLSGVHSVMTVKLVLACEGGGCTPTPFNYYYPHQ